MEILYIDLEGRIEAQRLGKEEEGMGSNGHKGTPAYQRIQSEVRQQIKAGDLKPGDAVASERELANESTSTS